MDPLSFRASGVGLSGARRLARSGRAKEKPRRIRTDGETTKSLSVAEIAALIA
jgi:hypothetical protein